MENAKDISREDIELFVIPSFTTLQSAAEKLDRACVKLGAQPSIDGLFTGRSAWQADAFDTLIRDAMASAAACGKH